MKLTSIFSKKFAVMAIATLVAVNVNAQKDEPKNEIGVFYSVASVSNILSEYGAAFSYSTGSQTGYWGPIGIEYFRRLSPVVAVGAVAEYSHCKWDKNYGSDRSLSSSYITVMPSIKFNWLRNENWSLYSGASAGIMIATLDTSGVSSIDEKIEDETITSFMFQATALGAEFGKDLRFFAEVGFGEKGVACAGLRYKF